MSENIQSIANGSFVLGSTSATTYQAGPGISITHPSEGTVRISNDFNKLVYNDVITAGTYTYLDNTYNILQKTITAAFTATTSYNTNNVIVQGSNQPWHNMTIKWMDVGNSYLNYNNQAKIPTNYQMDANRIGNVILLENGSLSYRGKDNGSAPMTGFFTIKWVDLEE
jgi:hypothetical protein